MYVRSRAIPQDSAGWNSPTARSPSRLCIEAFALAWPHRRAAMRDESTVRCSPYLAWWPRSGLPSANDRDHISHGILRHDKGGMPHLALAVPLVATLALDARQGGWLSGGIIVLSSLLGCNPLAKSMNIAANVTYYFGSRDSSALSTTSSFFQSLLGSLFSKMRLFGTG